MVNSGSVYMTETSKTLIEYLKKELTRMQTLPIGVQDFVQLKRDNLLYIDKTDQLLELIRDCTVCRSSYIQRSL